MTRVLVAEDEPGIALGLEGTLGLEGYQVEVVTSGTNAGRRAREESFDLILLDVMLPGKSVSMYAGNFAPPVSTFRSFF